MPIHHLTGSSLISGQSHGGLSSWRGQATDGVWFPAGSCVPSRSPQPSTRKAMHPAQILQLHDQWKPGFSKVQGRRTMSHSWKVAMQTGSPLPPSSGWWGLPQGGPAGSGGQLIGGHVVPTQKQGRCSLPQDPHLVFIQSHPCSSKCLHSPRGLHPVLALSLQSPSASNSPPASTLPSSPISGPPWKSFPNTQA